MDAVIVKLVDGKIDVKVSKGVHQLVAIALLEIAKTILIEGKTEDTTSEEVPQEEV
jgi:hypothetical protein